jgi:hypothetical protein
VYVYKRDGLGNWAEVQKLVASDASASDRLGLSVSVSGDAAVVGAYGNDDAGASSGSAYIFSLGHHLDSDGDGLADSVETNTGVFVDATDTGTDPLVADTDGDGVDDGAEVLAGTDPTLASPPVINSVTPTSFPGIGGVVLTLEGSDFGFVTAGTVTVDGALCTVSSWSPSAIECSLSSDSGTNVSAIVVTAAGQSSAPLSFSYSAPVGVPSLGVTALSIFVFLLFGLGGAILWQRRSVRGISA